MELKLLIICLSVAISGCSMPNENSAEGYTTGLERYDIPAQDLENVKVKASRGDRKAARRLMIYYRLVRHSPKEAQEWERLAKQ